jgi:hypothetical protein
MKITTDLVKKIFMLFIGQCCTIQAIKADLMFMIADYPSKIARFTDTRNYNEDQQLIAFKGFPVKIQAKGPWLDWTTKITLSALDRPRLPWQKPDQELQAPLMLRLH